MRRGSITRSIDPKNVKLFELHGFEVVSDKEQIKRINPPLELKEPTIPIEVVTLIEQEKEEVKPAPKKRPPRKRKPKPKTNGTSNS